MNPYEKYPAEMRRLNHWVLWKLIKKADGRIIKMPFQINGYPAKSNDPNTWYSFPEVMQASRNRSYSGIAFMFTVESHILFIDLDHCINENGELTSTATDTLARLPNAFVELSQSRTGLHLFTLGTVPKSIKTKEIEIYSHSRFCAMTGMVYRQVDQLSVEQAGIDYLFSKYKTPDPVRRPSAAFGKTNLSDDRIIELIMKNPKSAQLFNGQWEGNYPSHSEADAGLCVKIVFYAGRNAETVDRIFRQSNLYRPKWDQKHYSNGCTYGQVTIQKAIEIQDVTYSEYRIRREREQFDSFNNAFIGF